MWVPISNLMGPRGKDGRDGEKGDPGPVNVGLDPNVPITWDQQGGITFNLVDGSAQTVNLPIASAQSAGLLAAGGVLPTTGLRNITADLIVANGWDTNRGERIYLMRSGPVVFVAVSNLARPSEASGWTTVLTLPLEYRPPVNTYGTDFRPNRVRVTTAGRLEVFAPATPLNYFTFTYLTDSIFPTELPGVPG